MISNWGIFFRIHVFKFCMRTSEATLFNWLKSGRLSSALIYLTIREASKLAGVRTSLENILKYYFD